MAGGAKGWEAAGYRAVHRRQRAEQGVRRVRRASKRHAAHRRGGIEAAARCRRGNGDRRQPADRRVPQHEHPGALSTAPAPSWSIACPTGCRRPETLVVVNCAGRTRSIIGAQSLRNAGCRTRSWRLKTARWAGNWPGSNWRAGARTRCRCRRRPGSARRAASADPRRRALRHPAHRRRGAGRFPGRGGRRRTLYLLDVRSPEEYAAGHLPGSRSAPGGQLVQATDVYMKRATPASCWSTTMACAR